MAHSDLLEKSKRNQGEKTEFLTDSYGRRWRTELLSFLSLRTGNVDSCFHVGAVVVVVAKWQTHAQALQFLMPSSGTERERKGKKRKTKKFASTHRPARLCYLKNSAGGVCVNYFARHRRTGGRQPIRAIRSSSESRYVIFTTSPTPRARAAPLSRAFRRGWKRD